MTRQQFAIAIGASEKWVHNAATALGRRIRYTTDEARRLGIAHAIQSAIGCPLWRADQLAAKALAAGPDQAIVLGAERGAADQDGNVRLSIDVLHLLSVYAVRLAHAVHHQPRRRGRRRVAQRGRDARARARAYGLDLTLIDHHLELTTAERLRALDENALLLTALRHRAAR